MSEIICSDSLLILSAESTKELILRGSADMLNHFYSDFFKIVAVRIENDNQIILDSPFIQVTNEIKQKITELIESWKIKDKHIYQLKAFFDNIPVGNYISILPKNNLNSILYVYLCGAICRLNRGSSVDEVLQDTADVQNYKKLFDDLLSRYSAECNDSFVGESDKTKRICRFCGKSMPVVTFKKIAHAIPEGLGNKKIIDNEECDNCNLRFGNGLDNELIDYFSFHRGIFGIKGKKGVVTNKFKNGYITKDVKGVVIASQNITLGKTGKPELVKFESDKKLILQNVYKALARISLGTIRDFNSEVYKDILYWINDKEFYYEKLPKIALMVSPNMYTEQPNIINYTLKTEDNLPFLVSELHLKFLVLVYIVPVKRNDFAFADSNNYQQFWQTFKHYAGTKEWRFLDFSSKKAEQIQYSMKFKESLNIIK